MKNFTRLAGTALSLLFFTTTSSEQITITQSDMPQAGNNIVIDSDLAPKVTPGNAGPSQNWNFTALRDTVSEIIDFMTAGSTPYASSFPGSNLADSMVGYPGYNYFSSQSGSFSAVGGMPIIMGYPVTVHFNPYYTQITLPATYGATDGGTTRGTTTAVPFSYLGSDSGKGTITISYTDTIDAWGTMQTPAGTYNVLRQKHYELDIDSIFLHYSSPTPKWVFIQAQSAKMYQYRWYTNSIGYMLVQMQMDTTNTNAKSVGWYSQPAGVKEMRSASQTLEYPNPSNGQANFMCSDKEAKMVTIYDITGREITHALMVDGRVTINTGIMSNGMYLYSTTDVHGNLISRGKFSVQ